MATIASILTKYRILEMFSLFYKCMRIHVVPTVGDQLNSLIVDLIIYILAKISIFFSNILEDLLSLAELHELHILDDVANNIST